MRFSLSNISAEVRLRFATAIPAQMAFASQQTLAQVGDEFKARVRANIASAGFSSKWQNAFRVNVYPQKPSINGAIYGYHKIHYSGIYESGGTITGKRGFLWIALPNVPKIGRRKATPRQLVAKGVHLFSFKRHGGAPILAARVRNASISKVSLSISQLRPPKRKGKHAAEHGQAQPLFVGLRSVSVRKRFQVAQLAEAVSRELPAIYAEKITAGL